MKIIAKISVIILLLCQLTISFANNLTTNVEPEDDCYVAAWYVLDGDKLIEMERIDVDPKYIKKEGSTVKDKVDMEEIQGIFNIAEITKQKGLEGKLAVIAVKDFRAACETLTQEQWVEYCYTNNTGLDFQNQCMGANIIPGWCVMADASHPSFGCGIACHSIEL